MHPSQRERRLWQRLRHSETENETAEREYTCRKIKPEKNIAFKAAIRVFFRIFALTKSEHAIINHI
jgi:hypothetical protein